MSKHVAGYGGSSFRLNEEVSRLMAENEQLAESYSALARATLDLDEAGWSPVNQFTQSDSVKLEDVKLIAKAARKQTVSNSLLKRGSALRASYVFGRGFKMSAGERQLPPRFQQIVDDPINQAVLFGEDACKKNEATLFTDGNFFVLYDTVELQFVRVPLTEIAGFAMSPNNNEIVTYVLREFTRPKNVGGTDTETINVWYPTDYAKQGSYASTINGVRVDKSKIIFHRKENDVTGSVLGIPDCLPALPWAAGYSEYLRDGSKMLKALSSIAWQVKSKTAAGGKNASAKLLNNRQVASTAVTGSDVELSAMPRNNAVDLDTGRPLAAMAASAMEVSVDALLSGTGSTALGSQVLDQSTLNAAYGRQGNWESFFVRVLRVMGVQKPSVKFNAIVVDPGYRNVQSLTTSWMTGLFTPEVMQGHLAEQLGIEAPGSIPDGIIVPNNSHAVSSSPKTLGGDVTSSDTNATNTATSQGNSGAGVGDISNGDNFNRDNAGLPQ